MRLDRRTLLRGGGGIALALPFLSAMESSAKAEARQLRRRRRGQIFPTRFVVFFTANGTIHRNWRPSGGEADFAFMQVEAEHRKDPHILAPLEPWRRQLLILDGIAAKSRKHGPGGNGHDKGMGHLLTATTLKVGPSGVGEFSHLPDGSAGGPSIDQEVAQRLGRGTKLRSLELGVRSRLDTKRQLTSRMCYRDAFQVVPPENDPAEAFRNLFAGVDRTDSGALARLRRERKSVLDHVMADFRALKRTLGPADREKLDAHLTGLREVEQALGTPSPSAAACRVPEAPRAGLDPWLNDNYPEVGRLQMEMLVTALACDMTRVASLQWSTAQSSVTFTWLGQRDGHHGLSHLADDTEEARQQLTRIDHWYAGCFAYLLKRMSDIREGDGTLLDHSVVMWINEQGNGDKHTYTDIPIVLAGGANGFLRTGRYLRYADKPAHNDLFVSVLHAMGFDEVTSFGLKDICKGPLPGLT
jgi:hypothetical protein